MYNSKYPLLSRIGRCPHPNCAQCLTIRAQRTLVQILKNQTDQIQKDAA